MTNLGSAPVPDLGADDHVRGREGAPLVIEYADFECPYCAALSQRLADRDLRRVFRFFAVGTSHPRAWPAACAAEAAGRQGRFWEMHDLLFADAARLEDPHLWERARRLGLDLARFEADRRGDAVRERVRRDLHSGVRAGVVSTPSLFCAGQMLSGRIDDLALEALVGTATA